MKKTIALILMLIVLLCAALPGFADSDDLLNRIYAANTGDALRSAHESRVMRFTMMDETETTIYTGQFYEIRDDADYQGIRVRTSEYDYVALDDGSFQRFITLDMQADPWQFYPEPLLGRELISSEEADGALTVAFKVLNNVGIDYYPDAVETREVHVLDADTLELKSYRALTVLPDGSEATFYEATVEYDVEQIHPEAVEAIENHLYEEDFDTRTTTFIFDDDKPCKRTFVYETPVGDGVMVASFIEHGYQYQIDQERSVKSNEAKDNDAVYYMTRVVPEDTEQ